MTSERSIYSRYQANEKYPATPIFNALVKEKYDRVHRMTGFDDQDTSELFYKLASLSEIARSASSTISTINSALPYIIFAGKSSMNTVKANAFDDQVKVEDQV